VNVKKALKINKDKMMLAKIENCEQKKNIMLIKSKLKEEKDERMYILVDDDLTNEEKEIQKKIREVARGDRGKGKRVEIEHRKIQINGEWLRWDEREKKLKKHFQKKERRRGDDPARKGTKIR
jgi:hypothetical protein